MSGEDQFRLDVFFSGVVCHAVLGICVILVCGVV